MIKIDMPMPKNCLDCPACNEYLMCAIPINGRKWGENDVHEFGQGRPEWCPLKEQEAKTVIKIAKRFNDCDLTGFCPFCSRPLIKDWAEKYCGYCGNPVLWEGR